LGLRLGACPQKRRRQRLLSCYHSVLSCNLAVLRRWLERWMRRGIDTQYDLASCQEQAGSHLLLSPDWVAACGQYMLTLIDLLTLCVGAGGCAPVC
jgi:hypothetical protein